jgi:stage II sporulation SpoAA-like protein
MIEALPDLPPGTIGFRISGRLKREDYTDVLIPPMRAAVDRGEKLRILAVLDEQFHGLEPSAGWEDVKAGLDLGIRHHSAWERCAVVADAEWVRRATALFGWMAPGEFRVFGLGELAAAKAWLTE